MANSNVADYELIAVEGQMGSGKTTTATALIVDAWRKNPNLRIFTNFDLYRIPFAKIDPKQMMALVNTETIKNGIIVIDEAYIVGDSRRGGNLFNVAFTEFIQQVRKRQLTMIIIAQHLAMIDYRLRLASTKVITCSKAKGKGRITITIKPRNGKSRTITYDGSQYWKYFSTWETPPMSVKAIGDAINSF